MTAYMRTPADIVASLKTVYGNRWRDWLVTDQPAPAPLPLGAPKGKVIAADPRGVEDWIEHWATWVKAHPGTHLAGKSVRTPFGEQDCPTHLHIDTLCTLACLAGHSDEWTRATTRWQALAQQWPLAVPGLKAHLTRLMELEDTDFTILLAAAAWLRDNPRSGLMPRQVPVAGMHSKWLRKHRALVLALLAGITASQIGDLSATGCDEPTEEDADLSAEDLDALGLRPRPYLVNVILTDPADRARLHGLHHLAAPADQLAQLPLAPLAVLVIENKESALIVPDQRGLLVVHSLGNHTAVLAELPWMHTARVVYWGDLDRAGLAILARARAAVPALESVLMDSDTLARHRWLAVTDPTSTPRPGPGLTSEEQATYAALVSSDRIDRVPGPLRLEQERLPADAVIAVLSERLGDR